MSGSVVRSALSMLLAVPTLLAAQETRTARAVETARIGEGERTAFSFGEIKGLAIDAAGHLYVSDWQDHRIAVFDAQGRHVATIGKRGKGPGEFEAPTSMAIGTDGSLWVREVERVQRFRPERAGGPATRYHANVGALPIHDWTSGVTGVIDRDGLFHVPNSYGAGARGFESAVRTIRRIDSTARLVDSLLVPAFTNWPSLTARYSVSARSGRMLRGVNHPPFAAVPVWTSSPNGTLISGDALTYEVLETDAAGRVVRRFTRPHTPVVIDAGERRDSLRALSARIDSIPVPLSEVQGMPQEVRQKRLPTHYAPYRELSVSREGVLWVRRWTTPAERGTSRYDVFAPDARFLGTVVLPAELIGAPVLVIAGRYAAGTVADRETGLQSIVRFEVPVWAAGESGPGRTP